MLTVAPRTVVIQAALRRFTFPENQAQKKKPSGTNPTIFLRTPFKYDREISNSFQNGIRNTSSWIWNRSGISKSTPDAI
jgi:hypothetical protein